ncbi:MAG: D-alanyl-D-alanine carboxypeptidase [Aerococcus suis]|nr:D-alanyl-D-alanine carboxypeptidase [Aerococcus suis]
MISLLKFWVAFGLFLIGGQLVAPTLVFAEEQTSPSVEDFSNQLSLSVDSALAIDNESGQILYQKDDNQLHGIASLTKLLSLFVVYDAIHDGKLSMDTKVPVSKEVEELATLPGYANVPLKESKDFYTVSDLIDATIIGSANAAIVALAEEIGGSEQGFVSLMKDKLTELGISDYEIYTASGMNAQYLVTDNGDASSLDKENKMRARDILFLARELVKTYPEIQDRAQVSRKEFPVSKDETYELVNHNKFLPGLPHERSDIYGLKTGTEEEAGSCIIVITEIAGREVYAITMGADSDEARYGETNRLLDYLQNQLEWVTLQSKGEAITDGQTADISKGQSETTSLVYGEDVGLFVPHNYDLSNHIETSYSSAWQYNAKGRIVLNAPLDKDKAVNTVVTRVPFYDTLFNEPTLENTIYPTEDVPAINRFVHISRIMADMFEEWSNRLFASE